MPRTALPPKLTPSSGRDLLINSLVNLAVLLLLLFCFIAYLAIENDYQLICLQLSTFNSFAIFIWGLFWFAQSLEDIVLKSPGLLFSPIFQGLGLILAILYLPFLFFSPALCR